MLDPSHASADNYSDPLSPFFMRYTGCHRHRGYTCRTDERIDPLLLNRFMIFAKRIPPAVPPVNADDSENENKKSSF